MRKTLFLEALILLAGAVELFSQNKKQPEKIQVLTLGVFHFAYLNLDVQKRAEKDQINILKDPWQKEILAIAVEADSS